MNSRTINCKATRLDAVNPSRITKPSHAPFCNAHRALRPCLYTTQTRQQRLCAGKLDDLPLFADPVVGSSVTTTSKAKASVASPAEALDSVPLESEAGIDYTALRDHLKEGDFRKADDETRALLIKLAGENAVKRNWVYFTEVKFISVKDMTTLDQLWKAGSNGKFGYSVQKEMWMQNQKRWPKFFKQIDWVVGENSNYRKWPAEFDYSLDAPKGHLPLTNALRGTQLFQEVMNHAAFVKPEKVAKTAAQSSKSLFSL